MRSKDGQKQLARTSLNWQTWKKQKKTTKKIFFKAPGGRCEHWKWILCIRSNCKRTGVYRRVSDRIGARLLWSLLFFTPFCNGIVVSHLVCRENKNIDQWWSRDYPNTKYVPGFLKTGLAKITTHSTTCQLKPIKFVQRPIKSLYLTPGSKLMVPRSIPRNRSSKWRKF